MIINAENCACAEGFKDLTALMNGSLLISIFELSQEFRRICMLWTELKVSAVDFASSWHYNLFILRCWHFTVSTFFEQLFLKLSQ